MHCLMDQIETGVPLTGHLTEAGGRRFPIAGHARRDGIARSAPVIPIQVPALHRFRQMFRRHTFGMIQICNRPRHAQHPVMRPRR